MEIDFPSREDRQRSSGDNTSSFNSHDIVEKESTRSSILSGATSTSSRFEGGGSLLWPSTDEEGNKKRTHHRRRRRRRGSNVDEERVEQQQQEQQQPSRRRTESSYGSSTNYEVGAGEIAVDFPTDRTPFTRRYSIDEKSVVSGGSGIILDEGINIVFKEGLKNQQYAESRRLSNNSSLSGASSPQLRRRLSQTSSMSSNERSGSLNSRGPIRRRSSLSSISSSFDHRSNDSSADAMNAFSHRRSPVDLKRSLQTINSEISMTQSLREKELRQSLRASLLRRKSTGNLMGRSITERRPSSIERRPSTERRPSIERRPSTERRPSVESRPSLAEILEQEQQQRKSLVATHDATVQALPILGWDVENQSDSSSGGHEDRSTSRSILLRRTSFEGSMRSIDADHHDSIPASLVTSLNNNTADNPNPNGGFLCEEFISRDKFQKENNALMVDSNSGSGGATFEQLIMEEEYDPRKPWRKAPAVAVKCKNRRASVSTFRSSLNSSSHYAEFHTSMDSQQFKEGESDQQQVQDNDKLMRSSRSNQTPLSALSGQETSVIESTATTSVVDEVPSNSPPPPPIMEDASSSTTRRYAKADSSTVLSSLAQDDDNSELTELRHAQEALFPIEEGGFKKKLNEGVDDGAEHRYSEQSDAVSGASFGIDALENSEHHFDGSERKPAHRNDYSLDVVREEDERIARERLLRQHQEQHDRRIDRIMHKQDDDLPSSAGDNLNDDSEIFSGPKLEATPSSSMIRVSLNYTDDSIENEFSTTKLEDFEFDRRRDSKLYQDEDNSDVSELGLLFEATRNDDILKDESSSRRSGFRSSRTGSKTGSSNTHSRKTSSTLESAIKPIKDVLKKGASNIDSKTTTNIRRRNKRLWKFCVWNCRKITMCVLLLIGIFVAIGVLSWLGAVKNRAQQNGGDDVTLEKDSVTKDGDGNGLEGIEQPLPTTPEIISQPLERRPTHFPSISPSLPSSDSPTPLMFDIPESLPLSTVSITDPPTSDPTLNNETEEFIGLLIAEPLIEQEQDFSGPPSTPPSHQATPIQLEYSPFSVETPSIQTDITGMMRFSEVVPQDTEANLIVFLDALKKSIRSTVSSAQNASDELLHVEIISINGKTVDSMLLRRHYLRRSLQVGSLVAFNLVVLTECDSSGCDSADAVGDDVFSRVENVLTTSVNSGQFKSILESNVVSSSGGSLEYTAGVELGAFSEIAVTVLSPTNDSGVNVTSTADSTIVDLNPTVDDTNPNPIGNETVSVNLTTTIATSFSIGIGNQSLTSNLTIEGNKSSSNTGLQMEEDELVFLVVNETYHSDYNSTDSILTVNNALPSSVNSSLDEVSSSIETETEATPLSFNISALDALFFPSLPLVANETLVSTTYGNDASMNGTEGSSSSISDDIIENVTILDFNSTTIPDEAEFTFNYVDELSLNTTVGFIAPDLTLIAANTSVVSNETTSDEFSSNSYDDSLLSDPANESSNMESPDVGSDSTFNIASFINETMFAINFEDESNTTISSTSTPEFVTLGNSTSNIDAIYNTTFIATTNATTISISNASDISLNATGESLTPTPLVVDLDS